MTEAISEIKFLSMSIMIFLDIDGVLRPKNSKLYQLNDECRQNFEETARSLPQIEIVITSSWREALSLSEMRKLFSPDIASRIIGATPVTKNREGFYRYREVLAYLKRNKKEEKQWIALDDDPMHFPPRSNILIIDPDLGFNSESARRLLTMAKQDYEGTDG